MKFLRSGHKPEHIDARIPAELKHSRNYYIGGSVVGAATTGVGYESTLLLSSGNQAEMLVGGALALTTMVGLIATAGCVQTANDHRNEAWRINEELRKHWRGKANE